ncbi:MULTISPECIES: DUF418 domain-containing protein [unclassified Carboxylicivirga]|uniref:DUF418 domain-containing protein n=1 Tax=Carboxylicivirga TaxID=1628153 RepID=UPI003D34FFF5
MSSLSVNTKRIEVVDVLRGFAIMAIMLLHNIERFNLYVFPTAFEAMGTADRAAWDTLFFLFAGKTYSIFALLFGFTFYIQYTRAQARGLGFGGRYLWRLLLLAGFACVNAAFFPGEVLMLYAVVGLVLFVVRKWGDRAVLLLAIFFLLQPVELFYFFRQLADNAFELPKQLNRLFHGDVRSYLSEGTFWALIKGNTTIGQLWSMLWAIENGRFLQTAGLFLVGLLLGRRGWFAHLAENKKTWLRVLAIATVAAACFYLLRQNYYIDREFMYRRSLGVAIDMWWKLSFTFIWVSLFALLYRSSLFKKLMKPFIAYGRMSLTNYITQSIIGSLIYFPFALNMAPKIGVLSSLYLGVVLFILQIAFCNWWMKKYRQGPLEKLWHRLTWIRSAR